ncbi:MAG: Hpt domain-containing protein [Mycobacteriaceae bacterium]
MSFELAPDFDPEVLSALAEDLGDSAVVREAVAVWLAELPARRRTLREAIAEGDKVTVAAQAHSLASASALLGAHRLAGFCRKLEHCSLSQDSGEHFAPKEECYQMCEELCENARQAFVEWQQRSN